MKKRYVVMARWQTSETDTDLVFDVVRDECDNLKQVMGRVGSMMRELRPYQISITDREQIQDTTPIKEDAQPTMESFGEGAQP